MAEPSAEKGVAWHGSPPSSPQKTLRTSAGTFSLAEQVRYPNGGWSSFYALDATAIIIDHDICRRSLGEPTFDYSLITSKQNQYVARYAHVFRFLHEDVRDVERYLNLTELDFDLRPTSAR